MEKLKQYSDINDTLRHLKIQIRDSVPFALSYVPEFKNPEDLFKWLRSKVKYKSDPKGTELLQTFPTMVKGRYWGTPWKGDCDCFTIATVACCISQDWDNVKIVLVGRNKFIPVHIYTVVYWNGKRKVLDLTNREFDFERKNYSYIQEIPVPWKRWK